MTTFRTIFDDFLEQDELGRRAAFQSRIPDTLGFTQQEVLSSLFQPTFSRYLGALGRQIQGGQPPNLRFTDYLNQGFNPQRELLRFPSASLSPQLTRSPRFVFDRY